MQIARSYNTPSNVTSNASSMDFSLATDVSRPGVFLNAQVKDGLSFARVMLVLHQICLLVQVRSHYMVPVE